VTVSTAQLRQRATRLAAAITDRYGEDDRARSNPEQDAGFELAMLADFDRELLLAARASATATPAWLLLTFAVVHADRAADTDDFRAEVLARQAVNGIPADDRAFRPVHARMAQDLVEAAIARGGEADPPEWWPTDLPWPAPRTLDAARRWLVEFEQRAQALA